MTSLADQFKADLKALLEKYEADIEVSVDNRSYETRVDGIEVVVRRYGDSAYIKLPYMLNAGDL